MAKVIDQNIPAEMTDEYDASLHRAAVWIPGSSIRQVRHRVPFRIPHMRSPLRGAPSPAQVDVRTDFKKCVDCFNKQPTEGGAEPPDLGPRNRSWWYDDAIGSGLWYYNYFIQQSMPGYQSNNPPNWCKYTEWVETWDSAEPAIYQHDNDEFEADQGTYHFDTNWATMATYVQVTGDLMIIRANTSGDIGQAAALLWSPVIVDQNCATDMKMSFAASANLSYSNADYYAMLWLHFKKGAGEAIVKYLFNYSSLDLVGYHIAIPNVSNFGERNLWNDFVTARGFEPAGWRLWKIRWRVTAYPGEDAEDYADLKITWNDFRVGRWI